MTEDLKWSNYDFTKIPFDDIVSVGQSVLFFTAIFLLLVGYWAVSATINVVTVGRTLDQIEKTIDQQNYVLKQLTK
jgi:hypothetical protein